MLKEDFMDTINSGKWRYSSYRMEKLVHENGHIALWLPPHHRELNPTELVTAQVKHHVHISHKDFQHIKMKRPLQNGIVNVTVDNSKNCTQHIDHEEEMWYALLKPEYRSRFFQSCTEKYRLPYKQGLMEFHTNMSQTHNFPVSTNKQALFLISQYSTESFNICFGAVQVFPHFTVWVWFIISS
jgi:hypothetical protein